MSCSMMLAGAPLLKEEYHVILPTFTEVLLGDAIVFLKSLADFSDGEEMEEDYAI